MNRALILTIVTAAVAIFGGCNNNRNDGDTARSEDETLFPGDTAKPYVPRTDSIERPALKGEINDDFNVLKEIERNAPGYYNRLLSNLDNGFIVVDKGRMKVILYDSEGNMVHSYGMGCSKKFGTKHEKGDNRTPEGFFSVENVYDSKDWLFTDDDGVTSDKKGQFGPWFIRLRIPGTSQIGIHGTCAPWSIGGRVSHGCIRITNENIEELKDLVTPGMPVIVIPGKRDRDQNYSERVIMPYFSTSRYTVQKPVELPEIEDVDDDTVPYEGEDSIANEISDEIAKEIAKGITDEVPDSESPAEIQYSDSVR